MHHGFCAAGSVFFAVERIYMCMVHVIHLVPPVPQHVCVPHGAESGFDPYQGYRDLTEDNVYTYIHGRLLPRSTPGEWVRSLPHSTSCRCVLIGVCM